LETIRNFVKEYRSARGISQQDLATMVGVTRQTIISLEKGNYVPSLLLAINLSEVLETPLELLFIKETIR
jgi:putative transcriptional regulator